MKYFLVALVVFYCISVTDHSHGSEPPGDDTVNYIDGCEMDLTGDRRSDLILLIEQDKLKTVYILVRSGEGYKVFLIHNVSPTQRLTCHAGNSVTESQPGSSKSDESPRIHKTPGAYFVLKELEGSAVSYVWNGTKFSPIWIAD